MMLYQILLVLSVVVLLVVGVVALRSGRLSVFHPVTLYLLFHAIIFVLRPILAYVRGYRGIYVLYEFNPSWSDKGTVLLGANLALIVFVAASLRIGRAYTAYPRMRDENRDTNRLAAPLLLTIAICGPIAVWSLLTRVQGAISNDGQMVRDAATGIAINTTQSGYFADAQLMLASLTAMFAYVFRFKWWSIMPLLMFILLRGSTGGRGPMIFACTATLLLYLHHKRRSWPSVKELGIAAAVIALFVVVGQDRGATIRNFLGLSNDKIYVQDERLLEGMDFGNMEYFEYLVYVIPQRSHTYDYFVSYLQIFTEPVPRKLWPDKPIGAPVKMFELMDYGYPIGMTYSLPGAGWMAMGYLGIVIVAAGFGWIYAGAYQSYMNSRQTGLLVLAYMLFYATAVVSFRDGVPISILKQVMFYMLPIGALFVADRMLSRPSPVSVLSPQRRGTTPAEKRRALAAMSSSRDG